MTVSVNVCTLHSPNDDLTLRIKSMYNTKFKRFIFNFSWNCRGSASPDPDCGPSSSGLSTEHYTVKHVAVCGSGSEGADCLEAACLGHRWAFAKKRNKQCAKDSVVYSMKFGLLVVDA